MKLNQQLVNVDKHANQIMDELDQRRIQVERQQLQIS